MNEGTPMSISRARSDTERFARYQAVVDALLAKESFRKSDIYPSFQSGEETFIDRVITELTREAEKVWRYEKRT